MEIVLAVVGLASLFYIYSLWEKSRDFDRLKPQLDMLQADQSKLLNDRQALQAQLKVMNAKFISDKEILLKLARQKSMGFPWLAAAYADFHSLEEERLANALLKKTRPAPSAAEAVKEAGRRRRQAEYECRLASYKIAQYESLFPWLSEFIGEEEEDDDEVSIVYAAGSGDDPVRHWLSEEEYSNAPTAVRNQKALDRFCSRRKNSWEIGRDFERYVGYDWECNGYSVKYHGAIEGFADMGRDLLVSKGDVLYVVQCKYWSLRKTIHEKHIFQLFGTAIEYWIASDKNRGRKVEEFFEDLRQKSFVPILATSTSLSDVARNAAQVLGVVVDEGLTLEKYPLIKCNISNKGMEKIYHLPFDQQYDKVVIDSARGEFYAATVQEAESKGFRRAMKWQGNNL